MHTCIQVAYRAASTNLNSLVSSNDGTYLTAPRGSAPTINNPASDNAMVKIDGAGITRVLQVHPGDHYLVLENLVVMGGAVRDGPAVGLLSVEKSLDEVMVSPCS